MKKIICFILVLIIILMPLNIVRATEAIELTQASFDLLNNGVDLLSYSGSVPYGFLPFVFSSEKNYQDVLEYKMQKEDVFIIDGNANIQIRPLTQNEYGLLENAYVYDDNGDVVSLSDLYFGTVDNGYFTEKFYCKNDGSIVYQDSLKENPYIDVKFGGSELSYLDWENAYNDVYDTIISSEFNFDLSGSNISQTPYSYYCAFGSHSGNQRIAFYIYAPNVYSKGVCVSNNYVNGERLQYIYFNNPSDVMWGTFYQTTNNLPKGFTLSTGSYSVGGNTYRYQLKTERNVNSSSSTNVNEFYGNNVDYKLFNLSATDFTYDTSLLAVNDIVSYKMIDNNATSIDLSKAYSFDAISDYVDVLEGITPVIDPYFNYTQGISSTNYPMSLEIDTSVSDVAIPFPDSFVIEYDPTIDYPLDDTIDPVLITNNIPIISDLQNKFPFSIPWDIANLLKGLEAQRTTPYIDTNVTIPGVDYTWHIQYDLSDFDDTAELFRTLFLIAFIIGLAYFSYDHFFGS